MSDAAQEKIFQNDILDQMQSHGWLLGELEQNSTNRHFQIVRQEGLMR
jgi:type I restriction enzyme R subunit